MERSGELKVRGARVTPVRATPRGTLLNPGPGGRPTGGSDTKIAITEGGYPTPAGQSVGKKGKETGQPNETGERR